MTSQYDINKRRPDIQEKILDGAVAQFAGHDKDGKPKFTWKKIDGNYYTKDQITHALFVWYGLEKDSELVDKFIRTMEEYE